MNPPQSGKHKDSSFPKVGGSLEEHGVIPQGHKIIDATDWALIYFIAATVLHINQRFGDYLNVRTRTMSQS